MKLLGKILTFYSFLLTFSLVFWGIRNIFTAKGVDFWLLLLLLPPCFYFLFGLQRKTSKIKNLTGWLSLLTISILFFASLLAVTIPLDWVFVLLLFPLVVYFWKQMIFEKRKAVAFVGPPEPTLVEEGKIEDIRFRQFLKFLGGAGLGFVLSSLLNPRKVEATFFGSIPGPGTVSLKDTEGTKINPAREDGNLADIKANTADIKANTKVSGTNNIDEASSTLTYVGKEDADGVWVIMAIDTSSGTSITYATQTNNPTYTNYSDAWTDRASLTYSAYKDAF